MVKRLENGKRNRLYPEKPANIRCGCDPDEQNMPWCNQCKGTHSDTFICRKRAIRWIASLCEDRRNAYLDKFGDSMHPALYR